MRIFLGLQPILDRSLRTFAYELLFRSGLGNTFDGTDPVTATTTVISNAFLSMGAEKILGGRKGFINFPRELLLDESVTALPSQTVVVEILETVAPDPDIVSACRRLKRAGYLLALDDFVMHPEFAPLLQIADFVKVDFRATPRRECRTLAATMRAKGLRMLAEKVETQEEFDAARGMGYEYFQGYFFSRPEVLSTREVPTCKLNGLRMLRELQKPELDFDRLEGLTRLDVALAHKLLRYVNSAVFGRREHIHSLRRALVALGEKELRKLISLAIVPGLVSDRPPELARTALRRARTCETIAEKSAVRPDRSECFLMGLFSLLDAMVGRPLCELTRELGLPSDVHRALTGQDDGDNPLKAVYDLCLGCEAAEPAGIQLSSRVLGIPPEQIPGLYLDALSWSEELFQESVA